MEQKHRNLYRFGGISFLISSFLLLATGMLLFRVPDPPSDSIRFLGWLADWKVDIMISNELFFFAVMFLVPSFFALYRILSVGEPIGTLIGCGIIAVTVPVLAVIGVVQGRLVYPVYGLTLSPDSLMLVFSIYAGGMHAAYILIGIALIALSFATIRSTSWGKAVSVLGFTAGILLLLAAYPWLIGSALELFPRILFSSWLASTGIVILRK